MPGAFLPSALKNLYSAFADVVFPSACVGCNNFGELLCENCLRKIGEPQNTCIFCDKQTLHGKTCYQCQTTNCLTGVISVGEYKNETLRNAVHALKFSGVKEIADPLGDMLAKKILQTLNNSLADFVIVALPLHKIRKRERGFNQSELLAQRVFLKLHLPYQKILIRTRATRPQANIDHKTETLRKENVAKAFAINPSQTTPLPEKVIIIDDVATSGATLEEAAKIFHDAGVKDVWGAVICRG